MSSDVFDYELDDYLEDNTKECLTCSKPINEDKNFCSESCYNDYNND